MEVRIDGIKYVPIPDEPAGKGLPDALDVRFDSDAGDNLTVRDYLRTLMLTLWKEQEGFNGKRPFGNSGWDYELFAPLIKHGFIEGMLDEDGYVDKFSKSQAHDYVKQLILEVFKK